MNSDDVSQLMSEWMRSLSVPERMRALALMYSYITVATRELFFPQTTSGKERIILELLHGVNELHHTLANSLLRWGTRRRGLDTRNPQPTIARNRTAISYCSPV